MPKVTKEDYPLYLAEVIEDSIANGKRLTTVKVRFPRSVLPELLTHRAFSRNGASSRAMPANTVRRQVRYNPAMPLVWLKNKKGMQATEPMSWFKIGLAKNTWIFGSKLACGLSWTLEKLGLHKQWANRVLEPWVTMEMVISATEWQNFFDLRCHPDAQPEIAKIAYMIKDVLRKSKPKELITGQWHTPFVSELATTQELVGSGNENEISYNNNISDIKIKIIKCSTARCARVSYLTHDKKKPSIEADLLLHERLVGSSPIHASPAEHQAMPDAIKPDGTWEHPHLHGNFIGWIQYRKLLENPKLKLEDIL